MNSINSSANQSLAGKTVVLGVGGSVSAYKAADLCSKLVQEGARVLPILTRGALRFVAPATFWGLASEPVAVEVWDTPFGEKEIAHLHYAEKADIFVVAPASADLLARLAHGFCDDMLTSTLIANPGKPVLIAPAMNTDMWQHPAVQSNRRILEGYGYRFIEPGVGRLAEGIVGAGRLAEPIEIVQAIRAALETRNDLAGLRIMVTAGPTREMLDPVRYITNRSSGKMGYAVARTAASRGASVVLITGPTDIPPPSNLQRVINVTTAQEMLNACLRDAADCDVIVAAAAVADYAPLTVSAQKIKKVNANEFSLALMPTTDILRTLGERKRIGQTLVGFAAETEDLERNARTKLREKNLDLVVANDVNLPGAGFDGDTNIVLIVSRESSESLPLQSKSDVAEKIWDWVAAHRATSDRIGATTV